MSYPYRGGHPMGYPRGPPGPGPYYGPPRHRMPGPGYMPHPHPDELEYDEGPPHLMRGPMGEPPMGYGGRGGRGGGPYPRRAPPHEGSGSGGRGNTSASDTEGGTVSGFDSSDNQAPRPAPPRRTGGKTGFANDCEIVVLNKQQQKYAELVERQLRDNGLQVDLMFPKSDIKIVEFLKPIAKLGTIFAVVIDAECERGRNIHFYQFRGVPKAQYHKNVPLTQAYNLINRIYKELKVKEIGEFPDKMSSLLVTLKQEHYLEDDEYSELIKFLQDRRKRQASFLNRTSTVIQDPKTEANNLVDTPEGKELQKRILTLLNGKGD